MGLLFGRKILSSGAPGLSTQEGSVSCSLKVLMTAGELIEIWTIKSNLFCSPKKCSWGRRRIMLMRIISVMFYYSRNIVLVRGLFLKHSQDFKFWEKKSKGKFPDIVCQGKHMASPLETRNHRIMQTVSRGSPQTLNGKWSLMQNVRIWKANVVPSPNAFWPPWLGWFIKASNREGQNCL